MEDILKLANSFEGIIAIAGFGNGKYPNKILEGMKTGELTIRDYLIVDSFKHRPPQPAYDFRHKVPNVLKRKCELIKESIANIDNKGKIAILYIESPDKQDLNSILRHYYKHLASSALIVTNNLDQDILADTVMSFTNDKETSPVRRSNNFSYFISRVNPLNNNVSRTSSILT